MTRTRLLLILFAFLSTVGGLAQTPSLEITPATIAFGCTLGGEDSTRTIVIRNTGATDVTILEFIAPAEFVAPTSRDVVVPAGGQVEETLHFAPLSAGPASASGSLIIRTVEGDVLVPVSGEIGAEPTIGVNPTRLDFFDVAVGSSLELCITVSNPSCRSIEVLGASIDNPAFAITRVFTTPRVLGPFEEQTVCVTFSPTVPGDQQGELRIDGALGKRATVRLLGRGVRSEIAVEPDVVNFGAIGIGAASAEIIVEIVNRGLQAAEIAAGLSVTGANPGDFVLASAALPFSVGPGERAPLRIRFVPTAAGTRTARIVVNNSSDIDPVIQLEGRGADFDVVVTPNEVDMGDVFVGQSRIAFDTVVVFNRGRESVTIVGTDIEGADSLAFAAYGFVIARIDSGDSYVLDIEFRPIAPRVFNADLVISLENGTTYRLPLRGRGLDTSAVRSRHIAGDSVHARVGERRLMRFTIDPPLDAADTARRVLVRLRLDPYALYPHRVVADLVTASRSYSADGIVELIFSSPGILRLSHFDLEVEGLFTGRPINRVTVDSADLGDPRIVVTSTPGTMTLEGCDVHASDSLLRPVSLVSLTPSPATTQIVLRYTAPEDAVVRVLAMNGATVRILELPPSGDAGSSIVIDVAGLADGAYVVQISDTRSSDHRMLEVIR